MTINEIFEKYKIYADSRRPFVRRLFFEPFFRFYKEEIKNLILYMYLHKYEIE